MLNASQNFTLPKRYAVADTVHSLTITWKNANVLHFISLCIGIAFWIFGPMVLGTVFQTIRFPAILLQLLFWAARLLISGYFVYDFICGMVNSIEIKLTSSELSLRHFPLPRHRHITLPTKHIAKIYMQRIAHRSLSAPGNNYIPTFWLTAEDNQGEKHLLISGLGKHETECLANLLQNRLSRTQQLKS